MYLFFHGLQLSILGVSVSELSISEFHCFRSMVRRSLICCYLHLHIRFVLIREIDIHHHINNNILAMDTRTLMECDNVNGVKLSLKMETGFFSNISTCSPKSRKFTITYKSERNRSSWARTSLFIAVLFNIVVFSYIRISFTAFAYITLIFSFLAFFWVTHSVQSGKKPQYKPCSSY